MDKPSQIEKDGKTLIFTYGPQHMRFIQINDNVTTYYSDKLYEDETDGSKTTWRAYIDDIAVISQTTNEGATIRYTHRDRLGSARVFTDHNGQVEAERNYDPFGKPRLASGDLKAYGNSKLDDLDKAKTRRGFTDHEHLDNVELIHMNGRVYDYNLGRFMSVDPVIQSPSNSQSINPYSYIMNNPLSGTDPTGYTAECNGSGVCDIGNIKMDDVESIQVTKNGNMVVNTNDDNSYQVESINGADVGGKFSVGNNSPMDINSQQQNAKNDPLAQNISNYAKKNEYSTKAKSVYSDIPADESNMDENIKPYEQVTLHHTGSAETPKEVEDMHRANEGAVTLMRQALSKIDLAQAYNNADVGYHYMIDEDGTIYEGRSLKYAGAHVGGHNQGNIGVAFLGNYTRRELSSAQFKAARQILGNLRDRFKLPGGFIRTHGEFNGEKHNELRGATRQVNLLREEFK